MKRQVQLVGGPANGKLVMVEYTQDRFLFVVPIVAVWTNGPIEPQTESPQQVVYTPRRRGDYSWYPEGEQ